MRNGHGQNLFQNGVCNRTGKGLQKQEALGKWVSQLDYSVHKGVSLGLVSGSLEENWDGRQSPPTPQRKAPIIWLWTVLKDSTVQQVSRLTFLVSESKGSGVGVLTFWASSGGGANTRGSPRGRAAAKFISG